MTWTPLPADVYVDTSVLTAALFFGARTHDPAREYLDSLRTSGGRVYFSQLVHAELLHAVRELATVPGNLRGTTRRSYRLARWGWEQTVRDNWFRFAMSEFDVLLAGFSEVFEIPISRDIWRRAATLMAKHHLDSYDAIHVATALQSGVRHLATLDADFTRVSDINVTLVR